MQRLSELINGRVADTSDLGIAPDWIEATGFAWLAHQTVNRQPGNLPAVTGASQPAILGATWPA
jgi:anhydro-N-acetylmuramic acid kinase